MTQLQGDCLAAVVAEGGDDGAQPAERLSKPCRVCAALVACSAGGRCQQGQQGSALPPLLGALCQHLHELLQQVLAPVQGEEHNHKAVLSLIRPLAPTLVWGFARGMCTARQDAHCGVDAPAV